MNAQQFAPVRAILFIGLCSLAARAGAAPAEGGETTVTAARPAAYLFPARLTAVVADLQRRGIAVEELREDIELELEIYRVDKITHDEAAGKDQGRCPAAVQASLRCQTRRVPAGTIVVRTAQRQGALAAVLLEPPPGDGPDARSLLEDAIRPNEDYPVLRLAAPTPILTARVRPLAEKRARNKPITFDDWQRGKLPGFSGTPTEVQAWFEDGERFLQVKEGRLLMVAARTGRSKPLFDPERLALALKKLPGIESSRAEAMARSTTLRINPQRTGALCTHQSDLYFCSFDGTQSIRLARTPGEEEVASFSPDGRWVAFVRGQNLFVVDLATGAERPLTTDGGGPVFNGKADWVYYEEVFNRRRQAYWWSPDSNAITFLRLDDTPVPPFSVTDLIPVRQLVEVTPYPQAGDPNPLVKLGIASVGGDVQWIDQGDYSEDAMLIVRAGWTPGSRQVYCYVQDRAQTWLDVRLVSRDGKTNTRLFRETTKAWVADPGEPVFLKDSSFLLASERTGWRHLYHFQNDGKLDRAVTSGAWEVEKLHGVDEAGGWVFFSGSRDSAVASNLYRVKLDGRSLQRLTHAAGDHQISLGPKKNLYLDTWANRTTPAKVVLCQAAGAAVRTLDTNPAYAIEEYRFAKIEPVRIKTPDGFLLEATLLKPPDFDPKKKYPVWFMTYGGPHAATIRDTWQGGLRADDLPALPTRDHGQALPAAIGRLHAARTAQSDSGSLASCRSWRVNSYMSFRSWMSQGR